MALFKILRGRKENLPKKITDGYAYFTINDGKFYIDASTGRTIINPTPDWNATSTEAGMILNKPKIPTKFSDLENDVGAQTVTASETEPSDAIPGDIWLTTVTTGIYSNDDESIRISASKVEPSNSNAGDMWFVIS